MPNYDYICDFCFKEQEIFHGINEQAVECPLCFEPCLKKIPTNLTINKDNIKSTLKPGEVVKQSIEEIRNDVAAEKESLKQRVFIPPKK